MRFPGRCVRVRARLTGVGCAAWRAAPDGWELVHADYHEKKEYVISAVLHLGPADETALIGGETGLVDELNERGLVRGLVVAPRRGRLVAFSGGGENYHAPMGVEQGTRAAWHTWFSCAGCASSGAAVPIPAPLGAEREL